jgi:pilus assembly protein TadC
VRRLDKAAALFSFLSSLCFLAALRLILGPTLPSMALALTLPSLQYLLLAKLHPRRVALSSEEAWELESFLHNLSVKLGYGLSLEAALQRAAQEHEGRLRAELVEASRGLEAGATPEEALKPLRARLRSSDAGRLLSLVPRLAGYSSLKAGQMVGEMVRLLERNRRLKERLLSSIRREELKVRTLSMLYPCTLTALYLLARQMAKLTSYVNPFELIALNISLASLSAITPFYATLAVAGGRPLQRSMLSLSTYVALQIVLAGLLP